MFVQLSREDGGIIFVLEAETTYLSASLRFIKQDQNDAAHLRRNGGERGKSYFSYSISNKAVVDDSNGKRGTRFDAGVRYFSFPEPISADTDTQKKSFQTHKTPSKTPHQVLFFSF